MKTTDNKDSVARAESALLLSAISKEYSKPEGERNDVFVKKCSDLLTSADEENRGPEELKKSLLEKAREKKAASDDDAKDVKKRKTKIVRAVLIAAAAVVLLATGALAMTRVFPYYVNHNAMDKDEIEEVLHDPDKYEKTPEEEAIAKAYDIAAQTYGDFMYDFSVRQVLDDIDHWLITLAREYKAADFTVYGPECEVTVFVNGEIGLCIYNGSEGPDVQSLIEDLSLGYLEETVDAYMHECYGDEPRVFEFAGITSEVREWDILAVTFEYEISGPVLRIAIAPRVDPVNFPNVTAEEMEMLELKISMAAEYYDFDLETRELRAHDPDEPGRQITREEAIDTAYQQMARFQGDEFNDLVVKDAYVGPNPLDDSYEIWTVILAKEYSAKDFTVFGPFQRVTLRLNGDVNSVGSEGHDNEDDIRRRIGDISLSDIEEFVASQVGDGAGEYGIQAICYKFDDRPLLSIEVRFDPDTVEYYEYDLEW